MLIPVLGNMEKKYVFYARYDYKQTLDNILTSYTSSSLVSSMWYLIYDEE